MSRAVVVGLMSLDAHDLQDVDYGTRSHGHRLCRCEREALLRRHSFFLVLRRALPLVKVEEVLSRCALACALVR